MQVPFDVALNGVAIVFLFFLLVYVADLQRRLAKLHLLEEKIDLLLEHAGIEYDPLAHLPESVLKALQNGNKIEAIREYRKATETSLKEAKEFVELAQLRRMADKQK